MCGPSISANPKLHDVVFFRDEEGMLTNKNSIDGLIIVCFVIGHVHFNISANVGPLI